MPKADTKPKFYAVRSGRKSGVFQTWSVGRCVLSSPSLCREEGADEKGADREECQEQVHGFVGARYKKFKTEEEAQAYVAGVPIAPSWVHSPASKSPAPGDVVDETGWDVVYCDGACKGNGMPGSVAGIGVWWGKNDPR